MNILFLANHLNVGGITSYLYTLSSGLKTKGHNVYLASGPGDWEGKFLAKGITLIKVPLRTKSEMSPKVIVALFRLLPRVKKEKIDIIHANTRVTQVLGFWLSKFSGIPYVSSCHGFFRPRLIRRWFGRWGRSVIAISDSVKQHLVTDLKVRPQMIEVIYNGVDTQRFRIDREEKFLPDLKEGPVIGIIARLSPVKGHKYLITAFKEVLVVYKNAQLLIIGEGNIESELKSLARELNIDTSVHFIPSVEDTAVALSRMDVFVMPSLQEGLGLALLEAMAEGRAVVASDTGGIKDLVKDGYNGRLARPADAGDLARVIIELLSLDAERKRLGENAAKYIEENFSQDKMINKTEEFFRRCLKQ